MSTTTTEKKRPLLSVPIKYAIVGGILNIVLFFVLVFFDQNPLVTEKAFKLLFDFLILGVFIFFCIKEFKSYYNGDVLRFWQGMTLGFFTFVYIGLIFGAFLFLYLSINPDLVQDYILHQTEMLMSQKEAILEMYDEQTYREWLADMKLVTYLDFVADDFMTKFVLGFFASLILSIGMRSSPLAEPEKPEKK